MEPQNEYFTPNPGLNQPVKRGLKKYSILGIVTLLIIAVGLVVVMKVKDDASKTQNNQAQALKREAIIQITGQGYLPQELTVKKGTEITWINADSSPRKLVPNTSGTSPEINKNLESGELGPGQSHKYTTNTTGSYTYHDSANPTIIGTIIVED